VEATERRRAASEFKGRKPLCSAQQTCNTARSCRCLTGACIRENSSD